MPVCLTAFPTDVQLEEARKRELKDQNYLRALRKAEVETREMVERSKVCMMYGPLDMDGVPQKQGRYGPIGMDLQAWTYADVVSVMVVDVCNDRRSRYARVCIYYNDLYGYMSRHKYIYIRLLF